MRLKNSSGVQCAFRNVIVKLPYLEIFKQKYLLCKLNPIYTINQGKLLNVQSTMTI